MPFKQRELDLQEEDGFQEEIPHEFDSTLDQKDEDPYKPVLLTRQPYETFEEISELRQELLESRASNEQLKHENRELQSEIEELDRQIRLLKNQQNPASPGEVPKAWERMDLPLPQAYAQNIRVSEEEPTRKLINTMTAIGIVAKYFASLFVPNTRRQTFLTQTSTIRSRTD